MKRLIWKFRFALRIRTKSKAYWSFCFDCAEASLESLEDDWRDESPIDSADCEMSYWGDN